MRLLYCLGLLLCLSLACNTPQKEEPQETVLKAQQETALSVVQLEKVKSGVFEKEIIGSGKLKARNKADLSFPFAERITKVNIRNGQRVHQGMLLATLNTFDLKNSLDKATEELRKASIEVQHQLISLGFDVKDSLSIPPEKWELARQQNGYYSILLDIQSLQHQLMEAQIRAPFSGIIADLEAKAHNNSGRYKKLCTLIDDRSLEVEFQIMESEYPLIRSGQTVEVQAFYDTDKSYQGKITQINPSIDEHGMLKVWAAVRNGKKRLLEGMNVKLKVKRKIPNTIMIPKAAVVNRQNRSVVFTYEEGMAKWNYVELGWENSRVVAVESGLVPNQEIIVSGNLDLAHNVAVVVDSSLVE